MSDALRDRARDMVGKLHTITDELTSPLEQLHAERLTCTKGCSACCVDDLTLFGVEAAHIAKAVGGSLQGQAPGEPGGCAFLDATGACRIYAHRPYVCRTQGLPLRWIAEDHETLEVAEYRDICPLNIRDGAPVELMHRDEMWSIGPLESKLAELQRAFAPDEPTGRVALRDLFDDLS